MKYQIEDDITKTEMMIPRERLCVLIIEIVN